MVLAVGAVRTFLGVIWICRTSWDGPQATIVPCRYVITRIQSLTAKQPQRNRIAFGICGLFAACPTELLGEGPKSVTETSGKRRQHTLSTFDHIDSFSRLQCYITFHCSRPS